jgi:hypothetical protein
MTDIHEMTEHSGLPQIARNAVQHQRVGLAIESSVVLG